MEGSSKSEEEEEEAQDGADAVVVVFRQWTGEVEQKSSWCVALGGGCRELEVEGEGRCSDRRRW